ncbi:MAG TPA: hypothetical protein VIU12_35645 [Chryseolinea sp.]
MNKELIKLFGKYALVLSVSYIVEIAIGLFTDSMDLDLDRVGRAFFQFSVAGLMLLPNVIIAFVIKKDKDKFQIPTQYVYLSTILYPAVGVCAFLLYVFHNERHAKQNSDEVSESL